MYDNCRLLLKELCSGTLLSGENGHRMLTHSMNSLKTCEYQQFGAFVRWSILHGGPGIPVLNQLLYYMMIDEQCPFVLMLKLNGFVM